MKKNMIRSKFIYKIIIFIIFILIIYILYSVIFNNVQIDNFITIGGRRHPYVPPPPPPPPPTPVECSTNTPHTIVKNCNQYTSSGGKCPCIYATTNGGSNKCQWVVPTDHNGNPINGLLYGGECQTLY
jgi:hypothetical protein